MPVTPAFCVVSVTVKLALAAAVAGGLLSAVTTRSAVGGATLTVPAATRQLLASLASTIWLRSSAQASRK